MAARISTPVLGVQGNPYSEKGHWQVSFGWRYQRSARHFVGTEEQVERQKEGSEVINRIHLADLSLRYNVSERTDVAVSVPYLMATRSNAIRNATRQVIGRYTTQARGIGDISIMGHTWLLDPKTRPTHNVSFGLGVKLPTGADNVVDTMQRFSNGTLVNTVQTVDQSIQPGDGGFGVIVDMQAFQHVLDRKAAFYLSGTYLINPEGTNGVLTYRGRASEAVMSIADQYLARAGVSVAVPGVRGFAASIGMRWEGVPSHDLIGSSDGFRRPGYAVSVEPSLSYTRGASTFSLAAPFAVRRNRVVSFSDELDDTQGDAAFADWLLLLGYSHRF